MLPATRQLANSCSLLQHHTKSRLSGTSRLCKQGGAGSVPDTSTNITCKFSDLLVWFFRDFRNSRPPGSNEKLLYLIRSFCPALPELRVYKFAVRLPVVRGNDARRAKLFEC